MKEIIDVVNEKDQIIDKTERNELKGKKIIYRCAGVYLEKNNKIVLQKRSKNKIVRPNNWDILEETLKTKETYEKAARRGLKEELGVKTKKLICLGKKLIKDKKYSDYFFITIYKCKVKGKLKIQKEEIEKIKEYTTSQTKRLIKTRKKIAPALKETFELYRKSD